MAIVAIVLGGIFLGLTALRMAIQVRRTGSTGFNRFRGGPGAAEWWVGVILVGAILIMPAVPILALLGVLEPLAALDTVAIHVLGIALTVSGMALLFSAQLAMGDSWQIGIEREERTELVTDGPFRIIRNPVYGAFIPVGVGFILMLPNLLLVVDIALVAIAFQLQVRAVEEPYLLETHGDVYRRYASRVGRFLPGVGLMAPAMPDA